MFGVRGGDGIDRAARASLWHARCMEFFATAAKNTEPALRDELRELGFAGVRCDRGGVHFQGDWSDARRCCFLSRIAMTVLAPLAEFEAPTPDALYAGAAAVDWTAYLSPRHTLAVRAVCRSSHLTHSGFIALRVKDAIVDQVRARCGARPSVDRDDPDVAVFVRLANDRALLALDMAGAPLHRRGYRREGGPAPLKETLAAALLRYSGWDRCSPLADPMCGSGTIPIEAALSAAQVPPGRWRDRFGFERWASHDDTARRQMAELRAAAAVAAETARSAPPADIIAGDLDPEAVRRADLNAKRAGVRLRFFTGSVETLPPLGRPGWVVMNPPYNQRLAAGDELRARLAEFFRRHPDDTIAILSADPRLARSMPRRATECRTLFNGDLECRFWVFPPSSAKEALPSAT